MTVFFEGEVATEELIFSGNSLNTKPFFIVKYDLHAACVMVHRFDLYQGSKSDDGLLIAGFIWKNTTREALTFNYYGNNSQAETYLHQLTHFPFQKLFKHLKNAKQYLAYCRLKGFNVKIDIPDPKPRSLKKISINNNIDPNFE